jgi:hypothetical protein
MYLEYKISIAINGTLVGYFVGGKGLRKGDPLSRYLFLIAMKIYLKLMEEVALQKAFEFHPRCSKLQLAHLYFANDLLFSTTSVSSIQIIKEVFKEFFHILSLYANPNKSSIFCIGIM